MRNRDHTPPGEDAPSVGTDATRESHPDVEALASVAPSGSLTGPEDTPDTSLEPAADQPATPEDEQAAHDELIAGRPPLVQVAQDLAAAENPTPEED